MQWKALVYVFVFGHITSGVHKLVAAKVASVEDQHGPDMNTEDYVQCNCWNAANSAKQTLNIKPVLVNARAQFSS